MRYVAIFQRDKQGWSVRVPLAPDGKPCAARGDSVDEARDQIRQALGARMADSQEAHRIALVESFVGGRSSRTAS